MVALVLAHDEWIWDTFPKTNSSSVKNCRPSQKESSLSTTIFSGYVSFTEGASAVRIDSQASSHSLLLALCSSQEQDLYIFLGLREPKESPTKLLNKLHVVLNVCLGIFGFEYKLALIEFVSVAFFLPKQVHVRFDV